MRRKYSIFLTAIVLVFTAKEVFALGTCGSANGKILASIPTSNLCIYGSKQSAVKGTGPWTWTCTNSNKIISNCSALKQSSFSCGAVNSVAMSSAPTSDLCVLSTPSLISVNELSFWTWTCTGVDTKGNQSKINCSAPKIINGVCGPANGVAFASAPTANLCSSGAPSQIYSVNQADNKTSTWSWTWTCAGFNGGSSKDCSARKSGLTGDYMNSTMVSGPAFFPPRSFGASVTVSCDKGDLRVTGGAFSDDLGTPLNSKYYKATSTMTSQTCNFAVPVGQKSFCWVECKDTFPYHKAVLVSKISKIDVTTAFNSFTKKLENFDGLASLMNIFRR